MPYSIAFEPSALKGWKKLQPAPRARFKKMLEKRLENPRVSGSRLSGFDGNVYRLKLSAEGLRLVYVVFDAEDLIYIVAVGRREDLDAYKKAYRLIN